MVCIVLLAEDVGCADRFQAGLHLAQSMLDQRLVIVAPAISNAGNPQPVLVVLIGQRDPVALVGSISPTIFRPTW